MDIDSYSCDCDSYPLINFCKHLSAVQQHFPQTVTLVPFPSLPSPAIESPPEEIRSDPEEARQVARIIDKIQDLAYHSRAFPPQQLSQALLELEPVLDRAMTDLGNLLPKAVKVPPNQHSWPETVAVMAAKPKTKRKRNEDPYGAGEQSGKKAKPDARVPKKIPKENVPPPPLPPPSTAPPALGGPSSLPPFYRALLCNSSSLFAKSPST